MEYANRQCSFTDVCPTCENQGKEEGSVGPYPPFTKLSVSLLLSFLQNASAIQVEIEQTINKIITIRYLYSLLCERGNDRPYAPVNDGIL